MENKEETTKKLKELLKPFDDSDISHKPVPTKKQTEESKRNPSININCKICGGWHHKNVKHVPYVGHAAVTKRLLDVDPYWDWDFLHTSEDGSPVFDSNGGLWLKLTILGVTRRGYGDAQEKNFYGDDLRKAKANAIKEAIGDAIRNAAMRFGVALELWHKGEFSKIEELESINNHNSEDIKVNWETINNQQVFEIKKYCVIDGQLNSIGKKMLRAYNIENIDQLPVIKFQEALDRCQIASKSIQS